MNSLNEVIVTGDWGGDSAYQSDLDVYLESRSEWKDLRQAFKDHDVITDNYVTSFFEARDPNDRARGYTVP